MKTSLSLLALSCLCASPLSATIDGIVLGEMVVNLQNGNSSVTGYQIDGEGPYALLCSVEETGSTLLSGLSLKIPGGKTFTGAREEDGWMCGNSFTSLDALNSAIKTGTYTASLKLATGKTKTEKFSLTSKMRFPTTIPRVIDYESMKELPIGNAIQYFNLSLFDCDINADKGVISLAIMRSDGSIHSYIYTTEVYPGSETPTNGCSVYELTRAKLGKKYSLLIQYTNIYSIKECSNFDGAGKAITFTNSTVVPFFTYNTMSASEDAVYYVNRTKNWELNALDGPQTATNLSTSSERFDLKLNISSFDYAAPIQKVELRQNSSGAAPIHPQSVNLRDPWPFDKACYFTNVSSPLTVSALYFDYDSEGNGGIFRVNMEEDKQIFTCHFQPTLNIENGILQSIDVRMLDANGGLIDLYDIPQLSVSLKFINDDTGMTIYTQRRLPTPQTLRTAYTQDMGPIDVSNIASIMVNCESHQSVWTAISETFLLSIDANPFVGLPRHEGWIYPDGATTDSFLGWFNDGVYPYVYSAAADVLANGTYRGDGKGWLYFRHAPGGDSGYYIYRFATDSWAYTRSDWHGWIYDYASGWLDLTPATN